VLTSIARRLPPGDGDRGATVVPREAWRTGDFVVAEVAGHAWPPRQVEAVSGRMVDVWEGDLIVGALGERRATLEVVGDWRAVGDDLRLQTLTRAGVLGRCTSAAPEVRSLMVQTVYRGHLSAAGVPLSMSDVALPPRGAPTRLPPVILLIASSMSAGKTTTAKAVIRRAARLGLSVAGVKLVGVARHADIQGMRDAGAGTVLDFVDAGLPSTVAAPEAIRDAAHRILGAVEDAGVDLVVAEAGASPLEPYGGATAVAALGGSVALTVLCASDPYAVRGVIDAYGVVPDLVAGRAATTTAGADLVARLTGLETLDVTGPDAAARIDALLAGVVAPMRDSRRRSAKTADAGRRGRAGGLARG
jgi:hypothetical protein